VIEPPRSRRVIAATVSASVIRTTNSECRADGAARRNGQAWSLSDASDLILLRWCIETGRNHFGRGKGEHERAVSSLVEFTQAIQSKWRFLAHFGAFWEGSVTDPQSQRQLITIGRKYVYHRRKLGQSGRGAGACDLPTRLEIDGHRQAAVRGLLANLKALAERLGAAVERVSHSPNGVFKAGSTNGSSKIQFTRAGCRIHAVATREGFGAFGQWKWGLGVGAITR
jgi:hypothetical protein